MLRRVVQGYRSGYLFRDPFSHGLGVMDTVTDVEAGVPPRSPIVGRRVSRQVEQRQLSRLNELPNPAIDCRDLGALGASRRKCRQDEVRGRETRLNPLVRHPRKVSDSGLSAIPEPLERIVGTERDVGVVVGRRMEGLHTRFTGSGFPHYTAHSQDLSLKPSDPFPRVARTRIVLATKPTESGACSSDAVVDCPENNGGRIGERFQFPGELVRSMWRCGTQALREVRDVGRFNEFGPVPSSVRVGVSKEYNANRAGLIRRGSCGILAGGEQDSEAEQDEAHGVSSGVELPIDDTGFAFGAPPNPLHQLVRGVER